MVVGIAVAYPLSLVAAVVALRLVGEAWWLTTLFLYLPRGGFLLPLPLVAVALAICRMHRLLLLQIVSVLLVLFPLMGFVLPWPTFARSDAPKIRVLSYNVNNGAGGAQRVLDEVARYSPDVVLLQETSSHLGEQFFAPALRATYPTVEAWHEFVFATRYTLSAEGPRSSASGHFRRYPLDTPLGHVVVYSVHTLSPRHPLFALRARQGRGLWHEMKAVHPSPLESNAAQRAEQIEEASEAAAQETDPVIFGGDTNLPGLSPVLQRFLSAYDDGFAKAGWGFGYTFPTYRGGPWMRIDRILTKAPLKFVAFQVGRDFSASDHLCVVADIQRE